MSFDKCLANFVLGIVLWVLKSKYLLPVNKMFNLVTLHVDFSRYPLVAMKSFFNHRWCAKGFIRLTVDFDYGSRCANLTNRTLILAVATM